MSQLFMRKVVLSLLVVLSSQLLIAQNTCNHISLNYNAGQFYYALGVTNNSQEVSDWTIEIFDASYTLDASFFSQPNGVQLTIETTVNANGSYNHVLTPDQSITAYQYLNFVYSGSPPSTNNNYSANTNITCTFNYAALCANLSFNYFNEGQYSFGFSVQNNNSTEVYPYEIHLDDTNYQFDLSQLNHTGFDVFETNNGNGTFDYYFLSQNPIAPYSSSPNVSTSQNLGSGASSNGASIACGNGIVSSGLNGGLESHGALATKIALRAFRRAIGQPMVAQYKNDNSIISELAPKHILAGDQLEESSPTDLVDITAAELIWAGDYYIDDLRFASILGSKTSEEIYDHTKVICDRVKGSELVAVEVVNIAGYNTILSTIKQPDNAYEYAISFSLGYETFGKFSMASYWSIDQYSQSPNYLNYQVWANSKAKSIAAVNHIIDNIISENKYELRPSTEAPVAPKLFARKAHYRLGSFYIDMHNQLPETSTVQLYGSCTTKELDGEVIQFDEEIEIRPGQTALELDLPYGNIFDGVITIKSGDGQKDVIYLADGSWGLDYNEHSTTIDNYEIISENRNKAEDAYVVERGISVNGTTDTYISIFKQLIPGGLPVDLSAYNTLSFDSQRKGAYKITLLTASNTDPSLNMSYTLETEENSSVNIPLAYFSNAAGETLDPRDITTIYIAFTKDNNESNTFDFNIENVSFRNTEAADIYVNPNELNAYPNPTSGIVSITHNLKAKSKVTLSAYDTKGALVKQTTTSGYEGLQHFDINLENQEPGMYIISLTTDLGSFSKLILLEK